MANKKLSQTADDHEPAFLLPQLGFFADIEGGFSSVALGEEFFCLDLPVQFKILEGWQNGLLAAMRHAMVRQYRAHTADCILPLPERIAQFRQACALQGIDLPADFILMLQQD